MIKAIIFDLGGVVLDHTKEITIETLAHALNVDTSQILDSFKLIEHDWVIGKLNERETIDKLRKQLSIKESTNEILNRYEKLYEKQTKINLNVLKLIDDKDSNVQSANNLGLYGILFKDYQDLNRNLEKLL